MGAISDYVSKKEQMMAGAEETCELLDDVYYNATGEEFETKERLELIKEEVQEHPEVIVAFIDYLIGRLDDDMLDRDICPNCGGSIEYEPNGKDDYVEYGSTYVCERRGMDAICERCGERFN